MKKLIYLLMLALPCLMMGACENEVVRKVEKIKDGRLTDGIMHYKITSDSSESLEVMVSRCKEGIHDVEIPTAVEFNGEKYRVTGIGSDAFSCYCQNSLTSVTIPSSVTSIKSRAFWNCCGLTSITIPESVTSIGEEAFTCCSGLTSIIVDSGNTKYDSRGHCNAIIETASNTLIVGCDNTIIPNSVTSIGNYAFENCIGLTSVSIPNSVTSIGNYAFRYCIGLTSVSIPNSVINMGENPFAGCYGLTSIIVESGNTKYDSRGHCNAIIETASNTLIAGCKSTTIPNSVTSIGNSAFNHCSGLTSVTIGNSVTSIGDEAFSYCSGLTSITIPEGVTSIRNYAFENCIGLTSITIPNSVTSIGSDAFYKCSGLTSITIPNSVTSIGSDAFSGCSGLTSVVIGNGVESIAFYPFEGVFLKTFINNSQLDEKSNDYWGATICDTRSEDGLCIKDNAVIRYCGKSQSVTIPNGVTSIGENAFDGCSGLTSITIPESVTSIAFYPFEGVFLKTFINNSQLDEKSNDYWGATICDTRSEDGLCIKDNAVIRYCGKSRVVTIPNSVTSIGDYAFYGCSGLTSITIPESVTSIGENAFKDCYPLTDVTCLTKNPPMIDKLEERTSWGTLHVLPGCKAAYEKSKWKQYFKNIVEDAVE